MQMSITCVTRVCIDFQFTVPKIWVKSFFWWANHVPVKQCIELIELFIKTTLLWLSKDLNRKYFTVEKYTKKKFFFDQNHVKHAPVLQASKLHVYWFLYFLYFCIFNMRVSHKHQMSTQSVWESKRQTVGLAGRERERERERHAWRNVWQLEPIYHAK